MEPNDMNRVQERNYTHNSEHQDASGISVKFIFLKMCLH